LFVVHYNVQVTVGPIVHYNAHTKFITWKQFMTLMSNTPINTLLVNYIFG